VEVVCTILHWFPLVSACSHLHLRLHLHRTEKRIVYVQIRRRVADRKADSQIHNQADSKRIIELPAGRVVEYELGGGSAAELHGENG
jgi:hypothetical protein